MAKILLAWPLVGACLLFASNCLANTDGVQNDNEFETLAALIWQTHQAQAPQYNGNKGQDRVWRFPDVSFAALQVQADQNKAYLAQLRSINDPQLSEQNQINKQILIYHLQDWIAEFDYQQYQLPFNSEGGFYTDVGFIVGSLSITQTQQLRRYLAFLSSLPDYFAQQITHMRAGLAAGNTQPFAVLNGIEDAINRIVAVEPKQSVFWRPVESLQKDKAPETAKLLVELEQLLQDEIYPSYRELSAFFVKEYRPNAKRGVGVNSSPNGNEFYHNRVRHYTTTDMTAEAIHQLGLTEVQRIRQEMHATMLQTGFKGTFTEFLTYLRTDPAFYPNSAEQLLKEAAYIAKRMDAQLPKLFKHLPTIPYGVAPVPDSIAPKYTTGRYVPPQNETDPGYYWVNTYALDRRPLYELEALTLHEAVPGHHLQISLSSELDGLPEYRTATYISAFGEGWGLYSEWLGLEVGFYQDPYSNFGRLTYEMWRACRLVVDTGIHLKGWTRQQAIDYMRENTALSMHNIGTEVDRYISWPGQALSYKIGEIAIKRLRQQAEQALGDLFDVRDFHYHVLKNGSIPLAILQQQVDLYIQGEQLKMSQR